MKKSLLAGCLIAATLFTGCATGSSTPSVNGAAAGGNTTGNTAVEKCSAPIGTLAFYEEQRSDWYAYLTQHYKLTSTLPVLRLLAQQTGCFVIVERGKMMTNMMQERNLQASGEMRKVKKGKKNRNWKNQMVAADYTISPEIFFSNQDTGGLGAAAGAVGGGLIGALVGGIQSKETQVTLTIVDNRSGVQIAAAMGHATATDFMGLGALGGRKGGGGLGGYTSTPEGKTLVNAFLNAMNEVVIALKGYKAQNVEGGLGQGGTLEIGE